MGADDGVAQLEGRHRHVELAGAPDIDGGRRDLHLGPAHTALLEGVGEGLGPVAELLHAGRAGLSRAALGREPVGRDRVHLAVVAADAGELQLPGGLGARLGAVGLVVEDGVHLLDQHRADVEVVADHLVDALEELAVEAGGADGGGRADQAGAGLVVTEGLGLGQGVAGAGLGVGVGEGAELDVVLLAGGAAVLGVGDGWVVGHGRGDVPRVEARRAQHDVADPALVGVAGEAGVHRAGVDLVLHVGPAADAAVRDLVDGPGDDRPPPAHVAVDAVVAGRAAAAGVDTDDVGIGVRRRHEAEAAGRPAEQQHEPPSPKSLRSLHRVRSSPWKVSTVQWFFSGYWRCSSRPRPRRSA